MRVSERRNDTFIARVYREAREYERLDINRRPKSFWRRNSRYIIAIPVSVIVCVFLPTGYPDAFLEMGATVLSVFIGLLLTALVFALDKFYQPDDNNVSDYGVEIAENDKVRNMQISFERIRHTDARVKLWRKQSLFYISKFNVLVGKNVITSLWTLALISICVLFHDEFSADLDVYDWGALTVENMLTFCGLLIIAIVRFLICYFLIEIFYNTIAIVSSMVNFMSIKITRI